MRPKLIFEFWATIFIPLLYFLNIFVISSTKDSFNSLSSIVILGTIISLFGIVFWVISFINLGTNFGVLPQKQKKVNRGLYKYFRHPMYIGIYSTFLGLSLAFKSWPGLVFLSLITLPLFILRASLEEKELK